MFLHMPATDFLHLFNICIYRLFYIYLLAPVYQKTFSVTNNLVSITKCSSSSISLIDDKYLNYSSNVRVRILLESNQNLIQINDIME